MAKMLLPNQHTPLHFIYGHDGCCLCNAENKIHELENKISLLERQLKEAEDNRDRFYNHLDNIAYKLEIGWWDGDFPIDEVYEKLGL